MSAIPNEGWAVVLLEINHVSHICGDHLCLDWCLHIIGDAIRRFEQESYVKDKQFLHIAPSIHK